jgi:hypothetical protein
MLEEPCIIQMDIDRYRAILKHSLGREQRARVEQLLAEANCQFVEAVHLLTRTIDAADLDPAAGQSRP